MVDLRKNEHARMLLSVMCMTGEYPCSSLGIFGQKRKMNAYVTNLTQQQKILFSPPSRGGDHADAPDTSYASSVNGILLNRKGTFRTGTVRFTKLGTSYIHSMFPSEADYFGSADFTYNGVYTNDPGHIDRNHRIAEATAMMAMAGIEYRAGYVLNPAEGRQVWTYPCFYPGKMLKGETYGNLDSSGTSRHTGLLFTNGRVFSTYNTRDAMMKWSDNVESKAIPVFAHIAGNNEGVKFINSTILFGQPDMMSSWLDKMYNTRFEKGSLCSLYHNVYYCTLNTEGQNLLRVLVRPDFREYLLNSLFREGERSSRGDCDGYRYGKPVYCMVDGNLGDIVRFKEKPPKSPSIILCAEGHQDVIRDFLDDPHVEVRGINMAHAAESVAEGSGSA